MSRIVLSLLVAAALTLGCDKPSPNRPDANVEGIGTVTVAVGSDVREVPYGTVECRAEGDATFVQLHYPTQISGAQGNPTRARVFMARWNANEVVEAHAFLPRTQFENVDYEMLHVLATSAEGGRPVDCRIEGEDEVTIACNRADVIPWLAAGERPQPSFKTTFRCP